MTSNKPEVLYYWCLQYTKENFDYLTDTFLVQVLDDPRHDSKLSEAQRQSIEAIFLPHGFSFNAQQLGKFPKLRIIASNTTTKPDLSAQVDRLKIIYLDDPQFLDDITATAEHALGLMHAVHRQIDGACTHVKAGLWNRYEFGAPKMLSKMHAVIWGHGRVGRHLSLRTRPLFSSINYIEEGNADEWINDRLAEADVLFLTMSVVGKQPVVTRDRLKQLPKQAIVINVSNGEVLDHTALFGMLLEDSIRGAGLDVLPRDHAYPYGETSDEWEWAKDYMRDHTNLIVTPHIAGSTEDAWQDTQRWVIDRVKEILCQTS